VTVLPSATVSRAFPAPVSQAWGRPRGPRHSVGAFERTPQFVIDTRDEAPDQFTDASATDWSTLSWKGVGRPYTVEKWSRAKQLYERDHGGSLPIIEGWRLFNMAFHGFFLTDVPAAQQQARAGLARSLGRLRTIDAADALEDLLRLARISHQG